MVTAKSFLDKVRIPLDGKWGYIWGTSGVLWTEAKQKAATREMTVKYGARWIGRLVTDCSGLLRWALKQLGEDIVHHARYQYTNWCAAKGKLSNGLREDGTPPLPGSAVFLKGTEAHIHHVGVYLGGGVCVEARGTLYGVVTSSLTRWDYWGELKMVDYTDASSLEGDPPAPSEDTLLAKVCNPQTWLNVRSGPSTENQKVFQVEKGSTVEVLDAGEPSWWQIRYGGRIGWASAEYLELIKPEDDPPDPQDDQDAPDPDTPIASPSGEASEDGPAGPGGGPQSGPDEVDSISDPSPDEPRPDLSVAVEELRSIRARIDQVLRILGAN